MRFFALALVFALVFSLAACSKPTGDNDESQGGKEPVEPSYFGWTKTLALAPTGVVNQAAPALTGDPADIKIGIILVGDETEGYSKAHIDGIKTAAEKLGIAEDQIVWKTSIPDDDATGVAAEQLYAEGCRLIISNSFGHQNYMLETAKNHTDAEFIAMSGDTAAANKDAGVVSNFANAFTRVYESRYVSGVVAGLKIKELVDDGTLTKEKYPDSFDADGNIKTGYVGAFNYAEVISGYTAFFLGIRSVVSNVSMEVFYTNSWFDFDGEKSAAENFINHGCVVVGQHADSAGAPTAVGAAYDAGKLVFSVGYNVSMIDVAKEAALTSATNVWAVYYEYAFATYINGDEIATNWCGGYKEDAVAITELGDKAADGTAEYVAGVVAKLKDGTLHVFDTSKFTYQGKTVTWAYATDTDGNFVNDANNVVADGYYHESFIQSAPAFNIVIDGITELN